jgi:Spy/CpxP family protein refolding chaperone
MPKKTKASTKKPVKAAAATAHSGATPPPPKRRSTRSVASRGGKIKDTPKNNAPRQQLATLEQAKSAAIDALIQIIEEAEQRLYAVKRARSYDELSRLSSGQIG